MPRIPLDENTGRVDLRLMNVERYLLPPITQNIKEGKYSEAFKMLLNESDVKKLPSLRALIRTQKEMRDSQTSTIVLILTNLASLFKLFYGERDLDNVLQDFYDLIKNDDHEIAKLEQFLDEKMQSDDNYSKLKEIISNLKQGLNRQYEG